MKELRLTEYTEGCSLWLPKDSRVLAVRRLKSLLGTYIWTVLEDAAPTLKTLRRFVVIEVGESFVKTVKGTFRYVGVLEGEPVAVMFEII